MYLTWESSLQVPATSTPAPSLPAPPQDRSPCHCLTGAGWEAWWDEAEQFYYCWNPETQVSTWECPEEVPLTTPAPPVGDFDDDGVPDDTIDVEHCPLAPAPWEAFWDEEEELCYCWNSVTQESSWECPEPAHPPAAITTPAPAVEDAHDLDNDGFPDSIDIDDDNDGTEDSKDSDDDNDGIPDELDSDDDNDGIPDDFEDPAHLAEEPDCPLVPRPWEAWWDEIWEKCYCWNPVSQVTTWDCPEMPTTVQVIIHSLDRSICPKNILNSILLWEFGAPNCSSLSR